MSQKTVLFDLDGTIIDSSEGITKSVLHTLDYYGMEEHDMTKLRKFIGPPLHESFKNYYGFSEEKSMEAVKIYRERYNKIGVYECSLYPGVRETLEELKHEGYFIGLASSKPEAACKVILKYHKIIELFDDVAGSTTDGRIVTKTQVLEEFFRRFSDINRSDVVLVGDTIFDMEGAQKAHIKSMGVSFGFGEVCDMRNAGALCIADTFTEISKCLSTLY